MLTTTRTASTPVAGASREGVRLAAAGLVTTALAYVLPEPFMADAQVLVFAGVAIGMAWAGKRLRDAGVALGALL